MKRMLLAIGLALALGATVQAKTPKEVVEPYKAYRAALAAKDSKAALKHSKAAWEAAEKHLGDHRTTGDLAQNFADIKSGNGVSKLQIKAMERAMELSSFHGEDADEMYLQRGVRLLEYHTSNKNMGKTRKLANKLIDFAKENGLDKSVFYAEALTLKATTLVKSRDGKALKAITDEALEVFENPSDVYKSAYPIFAHLYNGFGHEYQDEVLDAALSYQTVMEYVGDLDYATHPIVGRALGRWSHMRTRLQATDQFDMALDEGLCECWPYDVDRNESVTPIKRVPPKFSANALQYGISGYTIVQFDLNDDGQVINPEIVVSWPPGFYEKSSLKSVRKWKYSPRTAEEVDRDRTNLVSTIRYDISDEFGNPVY